MTILIHWFATLLACFICGKVVYLYFYSNVRERALYETGRKLGDIDWLYRFGYVSADEKEQIQKPILDDPGIDKINLDTLLEGKMSSFNKDFEAFMEANSKNEN